MLFVPCPRCGAAVELAPDGFGPERDVLWNVTKCEECELSFDYEDVEVQWTPDISIAK